MNIYLISQDVNLGINTYDSAVVIAENVDQARLVYPGVTGKAGCLEDPAYTWCHPKDVKVTLVGFGSPFYQTAGEVICASFNSG